MPRCSQVLLHKYSAQEDIVVGTPYANRDMAEVHDLMGPFLNTLALRLDLSGDPTFSSVVNRAKAAATQAFAHGAAPFAKVVDSLGILRSAAFTPIYQVWHTAAERALQLSCASRLHCQYLRLPITSYIHSELQAGWVQVMLVVDGAEQSGGMQQARWEGLQLDAITADRGDAVPTDLVVSLNFRCLVAGAIEWAALQCVP